MEFLEILSNETLTFKIYKTNTEILTVEQYQLF